MSTLSADFIRLRGARQNNLKGFDLDLPLGKLIVVTGLSGAGKSSLVFDTLHAEGQRRYVETFSPYTRQFLEMLDRPKVDAIENIRPSIAIRQGNTVKTSRSTVGTMTELCDYFKVWFANVSQLIDPATGEPIRDDNPQSIWRQTLRNRADEDLLVCFRVARPGKLDWKTILDSLRSQGFTRAIADGETVRLEELSPENLDANATLNAVVDKVKVTSNQRARFIDAITTALHFGQGKVLLVPLRGGELGAAEAFSEGLHSPATGKKYPPATPNLFSFNSPVGACPRCRGFGRVIELDERLVIPDETLTLAEGAIKPFTGEVYRESLNDLKKAARAHGVPMDVPWRELNEGHREFVLAGEPGYGQGGREWPDAWYGVRRFFQWLESNTYKMHVRVFLSRFRAYTECPDCGGARLTPDSLNWRWRGHTLPDLYRMPIGELLPLLPPAANENQDDKPARLALENIRTRLNYLMQVGLEYLTLDRTSRTLSGGETQRVSLTSCLGASLVDTLFVLDEPSIGLHSRDIDRLVNSLRRLTAQGNTVVVVEHDESVMRAADWLIEIGPQPGSGGGNVVYSGKAQAIDSAKQSITSAYLTGRETIKPPALRRRVIPDDGPWLRFAGASKHNLNGVDIALPLGRFVALTGVSGSGKSTLLDHVIHQGLLTLRGKVCSDAAVIQSITGREHGGEIVLVDQSPVSRTPRSNPAVFTNAWDSVRNLFAATEGARQAGFTASHFSFNSGQGRCEHCQGLGQERVEMQFLSDVYVPCPICEGKRFRPEILAIEWNGWTIDQVLCLPVSDARTLFAQQKKISTPLAALESVGLGYLPLGQPLNTLSGGESQRLKLVKYLQGFDTDHEKPALLLLDEPTTGLHRDDVRRLIAVLQKLVDRGHSLVVIEHQLDVILSADWLIEMGPGAGSRGGQVVFAGTPDAATQAKTESAPYLKAALDLASTNKVVPFASAASPGIELEAAEPVRPFCAHRSNGMAVEITGAREHNLRDLNVRIPHGQFNVVTGVSGSGKSSLAFDIVFAEGQRRFLESMSSYARQFVEQLPRPDIDDLKGIPPTVAIEQRVTRGTRKSTVATITEVAQYLRLLYAKIGVQHSPTTGEPVSAQPVSALRKHLADAVNSPAAQKSRRLYLCAPLVRARKGHHQPLANWAADQGYERLRCDGKMIEVARFKKLERYREHDIDLPLDLGKATERSENAQNRLDEALKRGKGSCFLLTETGETLAWFSTSRTDPVTGEAFPELDPKHFSWNSPRGWCPACRGHGYIHDWMLDHDDYEGVPDHAEAGKPCPECAGTRLNPISRAVRLRVKLPTARKHLGADTDGLITLPELLAQSPSGVLALLGALKLDARAKAIAAEIVPEVVERLKFMDRVGLSYLSLDRATATLSGGEAQRIRLAAQLGSNLAGVLYVLDEPSIGLHARDNDELIQSLHQLRDNGNTLLVVEHDDETMRAADHIIDLGPGAGVHGGAILAEGSYSTIMQAEKSLTGRLLKDGIPHPLRGQYRPLPPAWNPRSRAREASWLVLREPRLRNLKGGELRLPLERLIMVSGVSGAGKSTLLRDLLHPVVADAIQTNAKKLTPKNLRRDSPLRGTNAFQELFAGNAFRKVIEVDQAPIGKTPRSTPATYIGAFDLIREVFASLPEARMRGLKAGAFSFNTRGGRCETCKGAGRIKLEMAFLPNCYQPCEDCGGRRYSSELLDMRWKGQNIADVLEMTFDEAATFFDFHSRLSDLSKLMVETGLGYLTLGQSSPTLSGGEAQRLKLVSELALGLPSFREKSQNILRSNLYILEEPTIGLHLSDCQRLIELLHRLVDQRHTVIVIEHNLDLIAEADYAVEIGPTGGEGGGEILFQGPVRELAKQKNCPTASYLRRLLG